MFQYCSRFVSGQTTDLHQLSGKHFLNSLTLEKQENHTKQSNTTQTQQRDFGAYLVFDSAVVKLGKGNE